MEKIKNIVKEEMGSVLTEEERKDLEIEDDRSFITKGKTEVWKEQFEDIGAKEIKEVLDLTIKEDDTNKIIVFLSFLSAYTEDNQLNVSFNAPSSTGKSYIPLEISSLFPKENILKIGYSSPTAFFHDKGEFRKEIGGYSLDLSRKVLIFLDQPHPLLLQHLRPILSHDEKEITLKITDKSQKYGLKTKNIVIKGFPVVIFCSAGLKMDEQEITRFLLLSPEITPTKIREGVFALIDKEANREEYNQQIEENPERRLLKQRVSAIQEAQIKDIELPDVGELVKIYRKKRLKPKDMRDSKKLIFLIKSFALLNFFHREIKAKNIVANRDDIENGINLWEKIALYQEYGLPPYIFNFFQNVIVPAYQEKNKDIVGKKEGITINEILQTNYKVYETSLPDWKLKREILPMLSMAGFIREEKDPEDRRQKLIYPTEK